jgi:hypothetical protein
MMEKRVNPGYLTRYAAHAGISKQAASKQLKRVGIDYMQEFDFADADRRRTAARSADRIPFAKPVYDDRQPDQSSNPLDDEDEGGEFVFSKNQAKREHYKAEIARLEYEERIKKLVRVDLVEAEWFRLARLIRDAVLNVPARVAGILAAESDQHKVHGILEKELRQALESLVASERAPA